MYEKEQINWSEYWHVLVERKNLIGVIVVVSTLLAAVTAFLMTPIYRAEVLLAPVSEEKMGNLSALASQFGDLASLNDISLGVNKDKTAEAIAALKSRSLSVAFINEGNLKSILFPRKWDDEKKKWKDNSTIPSDWDAYEIFDKDIRSVNLDKKTGLVTLSIDWKEPGLAAKWANSLVERVNTRLRTEAVEDAEKSIVYLEKQLQTTSAVEIQQSIYRLIETQTKKKMVASTREEYAFTVIDPAVPPERKVRPKRLAMIAIGAFAGFLISAVVIFIRPARKKS